MVKRRYPFSTLGLVLSLSLTATTLAQTKQPPSPSSVRLGFHLEYLSQTLSWDDNGNKSTSRLESPLAALVLQFRLNRDSSASFFLGYVSSNLDGLFFRKLPFSIDFEGGATEGFLLGAELEYGLFASRNLSIKARGQLLADLGSPKKWDIPGLAVTGNLEGKPVWMRAMVGPVLVFGREGMMRPYLHPFFHYLWGTFEMKETIQSLSGKEIKDIRGKSQFGITAGIECPVSPKLSFKGEAAVYPHGGGTDYSVMIRTLYSF
jgi:hypothetical protein